jgi:flagellar M-ring protein FliF
MDQIKKIFSSLSRQQLTAIAVVVLLTGVSLAWFVKWNHNRDFKPLFTGMSPEDAAAVVAKIKETGVEHQLSENGTSVLVPSAKVDEIRLELAAAGLPKTGRVGFELFDRNNLGITDFTEHVNYRRALEGELERSIKALNVVDQARVHLTFPKDSVFVDYREPAKASVLISTRAGNRLTPQNVLAISNLVGSAVEGLSPESVSVLDMQGNLLSRPKKHLGDDQPSEAILDYRHQIEKDLVSKMEATLEPLLGEGRFRVGVTADCDFSTSEQSEEVLDPTKSAMVTSQKSEDAAGSAIAAGGVPGTQANSPRGTPARPGTGVNSTRRTESTSFETSKVVRHTKMPQGSIKRVSASLLLDQEATWEGKGKARHRVFTAPSPEKIKAINDIIAGVIGLDTARGDKLVIESLPFSQNLSADPGDPGVRAPAVPQTLVEKFKADPKLLYGVPAGVLVLGILAFLFLRRRRLALLYAKKKALAEAAEAKERAQLEAAIAAAQREEENVNAPALPAIPKVLDALRLQVREFVRKDPQTAAEVLRSWCEDPAAAAK